jgi:hypothetical protein
MRLLTVGMAIVIAVVFAIRVLYRTGVIGDVIHRQTSLTRKAIENVDLEYQWAKEGAKGSAMIGSFTMTNNNDFDVKDLAVTCEHFSDSGNVDSSTRTIHKVVKAHSSETIKDFNTGLLQNQSVETSCRINNLTTITG